MLMAAREGLSRAAFCKNAPLTPAFAFHFKTGLAGSSTRIEYGTSGGLFGVYNVLSSEYLLSTC
jgi:hypothetical protein